MGSYNQILAEQGKMQIKEDHSNFILIIAHSRI